MVAPACFDAARGLLSPSVFSDPAIHRAELASLFRRHWLFLGSVAWAAGEGDYFTTLMGDTPVLVWRGAGETKAFVNRCLGGDLPLAEGRGSADGLRCPCHGWRYAPAPAAGFALPEAVARLDHHTGLLFGCFDPDAPPFATALGEFALYFDAILESLPGGIQIVGEMPLVSPVAANWKLAAEAYAGDLYRDFTLTRASREVLGEAPLGDGTGFQAATDGGAIVMAEAAEVGAGAPIAGMRPISATLFPNLSYDGRAHALHVWHPRAAERTEIHSFALAGRAEMPMRHAARQRAFQLRFGPMGLETGEHEPVWRAATRASRGPLARAAPLNLQMGLGRERRGNLPGVIGDYVSEGNQRRFYGWWERERMRFAAMPPPPARLRVVRPDRIKEQKRP